MSVFGGRPSLFASTSQSQGTTPFPTLAGTAPSQPTQAAGGLFATPAAAPAAAATGGLFGSGAAAPKPAGTGGLFGASTATQGQPQAGGGLFGQQQQQQQQQQPPQQQPSAFGGSTAAAPALGASILSAPSFATTQNPAQGQSQTQPTGAYFDSLLAKSKKQADGEATTQELPSLQLGLGDLRQRLKKLGPREQTRALDGKAHYVLAASGVDPGAAVKDLGAFGVSSGIFDKPQAAGSTEVDVETYLSNLQTKTTMSMIADGLERSVRDFDSFLEDNVTMEWDAQRQRIYEHFGIKPRDAGDRGSTAIPGKEATGGFGRSRRSRQSTTATPRSTKKASAFGRSSLHQSIIGTPSRIGAHASEFTDVEPAGDAVGSLNGVVSMDERFVREKQTKLAEKIHSLNDHRMSRKPYPILTEIAEIETKSGDRHAPHLVEAYHALREIVGENPEADTTVRGATAKQRQFAKDYLDPNPNSINAVAIRKRILAGANRHLEKQFLSEVEATIAKHPSEAVLGGRPDVVSKIKAYVRVREVHKKLAPDNSRLQKVGDDYIWAIVFYLLRSGHVNEAATYVNDNQHHFRGIDRTFSGYMNSYASSDDRRLKRAMQDRCNNEYNQRARNAPEGSIDPFRMACYKVIGRCDVNNRSLDGIQTDVNDWIWLQFNLAREGDRSSEFANEMYGLAELQSSIREIGLKHFPKNSSEATNGSFGMFFYLQVLSGLFEQAIAYLYSFSYVDAVHFAVALEFYGLLRAADALMAGNELLSYSTRGLPQINFARMIGYYTRDFRAANVVAAVDYLVLICLNMDDMTSEAGKQQAALCHEALRELVLETREFSKLIGDIKPDGTQIRGVIEERGRLIGLEQEQDFIKTISLQAANFADDSGRTTDAVLLYHLAGDYDTVVAIVSRALSEAIALDFGEDPMKLVPVKPRVDGEQAQAEPGSSLSLAAIDDPVELARTMMTMYERDQRFRRRIRDTNRIACGILLQMSEIKGHVEGGHWAQSLDKIRGLEILPLDAKGDPSTIRNYAAKFSSLAQPVAINVPNLLMWTIICCTKQRERLLGGQFSGNESAARMLADELKQISVDLTTYTSQLRYRFPAHLHEALARASAD